jgi:hypothetical protein
MSEKSVAEKLLIKENYRVLFIDEPAGFRSTLGGLPAGASVFKEPSGAFDLIQFFVSSRARLEAQLPGLKKLLKPQGLLWVTYPKGMSKVKADINRDTINAYARSLGFQGVAMISIDDTWSALRLKVM